MGDPFEGHRFPRGVILLAARRYCRFLFSYADGADLLAERSVMADRVAIIRRVRTGMSTRPVSASVAAGVASGAP